MSTDEAVSTSAAWRARRYVLIPVIPILTVVGTFGVFFAMSALPTLVAAIVAVIVWGGSLYHAARNARAKWVVAIALVWPVFIAYWLYILFGLDRR